MDRQQREFWISDVNRLIEAIGPISQDEAQRQYLQAVRGLYCKSIYEYTVQNVPDSSSPLLPNGELKLYIYGVGVQILVPSQDGSAERLVLFISPDQIEKVVAAEETLKLYLRRNRARLHLETESAEAIRRVLVEHWVSSLSCQPSISSLECKDAF